MLDADWLSLLTSLGSHQMELLLEEISDFVVIRKIAIKALIIRIFQFKKRIHSQKYYSFKMKSPFKATGVGL
jgi:hypothetical protein